MRLGARQRAAVATPADVVVGDDAAALRAHRGIGRPRRAGRDPGDVVGRLGRPDHQGVVGVGHHVRGACRDRGGGAVGSGGVPGAQLPEHGPPAAADDADLAVAVELVTAEVEQHDHGGPELGGDHRQRRLVDLEGDAGAPQVVREGGHHAGAQVGPRGVGDHAAPGPEGGGEQVGGGGLAVGARDGCDPAALGEVRDGVLVEPEPDVAADDGAAAAQLAGHPAARPHGCRHEADTGGGAVPGGG